MKDTDAANGHQIPRLGLGTWRVPAGHIADVTRVAVRAGFRRFDTAPVYENDAALARSLRRLLPRDELFVVTKLPLFDHGYRRAMQSLDSSLSRMGLDYVDLYLVHWPDPVQNLYVESWLALEDAVRAGKTRMIGVSNFTSGNLDRIVRECTMTPTVNQIELHPYLQQRELRHHHESLGVLTESWSPLAQGEVGNDAIICAIAGKHGRSPAQVVLRWQLEMGNLAIPRSMRSDHIEENRRVFDFELDDDDRLAIESLECGRRLGGDPAVVTAKR